MRPEVVVLDYWKRGPSWWPTDKLAIEKLQAIVAASNVPVTKLPPGRADGAEPAQWMWLSKVPTVDEAML